MNIFKKLFGDKDESNPFMKTDNLIIEFSNLMFDSMIKKDTTTFPTFYFESLQSLPVFKANHIHLCQVAAIQQIAGLIHPLLTGVNLFLQKTNSLVHVGGKVSAIDSNYVGVLDEFKTKDGHTIICNFNILYDESFKQEVSQLKKGQGVALEVKLSKDMFLEEVENNISTIQNPNPNRISRMVNRNEKVIVYMLFGKLVNITDQFSLNWKEFPLLGQLCRCVVLDPESKYN